MPFVQTNWWSIEFPEEWSAEDEDGIVTLADPDDIGALDITAVIKEQGELSEEDVASLAQENFPSDDEISEVMIGEAVGRYVDYVDDEGAWREWVLAERNVMLYVTYNCDVEDKGIDDAVVDQILQTLVIESDEFQPDNDTALD